MTDVVPNHVGLILDGNRRWAKEQGLPTLEGHRRGHEVFEEIAEHAFERGVKVLSSFVFSTENWKRSEEEVSYLMRLVVDMAKRHLQKFGKNGIKIVILGRRAGLNAKVLETIKQVEEQTKNNTKGTLAFCFNYGGHEELVDTTKRLIEQQVKVADINADLLSKNLYTPEVPPVDLIIRTSGEKRLSGFMLYRADYAELYFTDTYWPAFTKKDFDEALADYAKRQRRLGK